MSRKLHFHLIFCTDLSLIKFIICIVLCSCSSQRLQTMTWQDETGSYWFWRFISKWFSVDKIILVKIYENYKEKEGGGLFPFRITFASPLSLSPMCPGIPGARRGKEEAAEGQELGAPCWTGVWDIQKRSFSLSSLIVLMKHYDYFRLFPLHNSPRKSLCFSEIKS